MSLTSAISERRETGLRIPLPVMVFAAFYLLLLIAGAKLLNDPDAYWHLVVGRWIGEHRAFPQVDPFSLTMNGTPWIAKEWLSQILFAGAYGLAGWSGMVALAALAVALAFALLARNIASALAPLPVVAFTAVAFLLAAPHIVARPHLLALPVMIVWTGGLIEAAGRGERPKWILLPLMTLWANLHGGFILGVALVGPIAFEAILNAQPSRRLRIALAWFAFGVLAVAAALVTPYGPQTFLAAYKVLNLGQAQAVIAEWRPQDFANIGGFEIALLLGGALALFSGVRLPVMRIVILMGLLHLALAHQRNADFLGLMAPLLLAGPLAAQFAGIRRQAEAGGSAGTIGWAAIGLLIALAPATVAASATLHFAPAQDITPAGAVEALRNSGADRVFNAYDFGGYMIYAGLPPFIDGRTELYGGPFTVAHDDAVNLRNIDGLLAMLDRYQINATLLRPGTPAVAYLDKLPGWRRIYADDIAVVHRRESVTPDANR